MRQDDKGIENAFRFLKYWDGKEMVEAVYGTSVTDERAAANALKAKEARATGKRTKKSKGKQRQEPRVERTEDVQAESVSEGPTAGRSNTRRQVTNIRTQVTSDNSNIDPVLLLESTGMTGSVSEAWPAANVIVNETEMQFLRPLGYQTLQSLNGPQDGDPLYEVPAAAVKLLRQKQAEDLARQQAQDVEKQHQRIDLAPHSEGELFHDPPAALVATTSAPSRTHGKSSPTPRPRRKKMVNADAQTIQEGKKLSKSTRITRSSSKRGRQRK